MSARTHDTKRNDFQVGLTPPNLRYENITSWAKNSPPRIRGRVQCVQTERFTTSEQLLCVEQTQHQGWPECHDVKQHPCPAMRSVPRVDLTRCAERFCPEPCSEHGANAAGILLFGTCVWGNEAGTSAGNVCSGICLAHCHQAPTIIQEGDHLQASQKGTLRLLDRHRHCWML